MPAPAGGVLVVSSAVVTYVNGSVKLSAGLDGGLITSHGAIDADGTRFLLGWTIAGPSSLASSRAGDDEGMLRMLVLGRGADGAVKELKIESLGHTVTPSTITYLDDGVVFVGSFSGDSQVRCQSAPPILDIRTAGEAERYGERERVVC